jgi:Tfp pilus assembly protein PilF
MLQLQDLAAAEVSARELIKHPANTAQGYYILGQIEEARGQTAAAVEAFQQAAALAEQAGDTQLTVLARARLGYLMQAFPPGPTPSQP